MFYRRELNYAKRGERLQIYIDKGETQHLSINVLFPVKNTIPTMKSL